MIAKRIIPCLDMKDGRVVKGIGFSNLTDAGEPVNLARRYYEQGADEIVFLDISASSDKRDIMIDVVRQTASVIFIPFTVGGGIKSLSDISRILMNGADKVALNTSAVLDPVLISQASLEYGAQCVVVAIDAKWNGNFYEVFIYGGKQGTGLDAVSWAKRCAGFGCGEILLTSIDRDGTKSGFDTELISRITSSVNVPLIASGGAREPSDFYDAFTSGADAALAASIFHYSNYTVSDIKDYLKNKGVVVR